jgi:putative ABC transport system substrate-binding protein
LKTIAEAKPERLPMLAAELVRANVDVIVTSAAQPVEAARNATSTIPIVMTSVGDALGAGYVASLAHPGGNITGLALVATDQSTKRLQLIREIVPRLSRMAAIWKRQCIRASPANQRNERSGSGIGNCDPVVTHPHPR